MREEPCVVGICSGCLGDPRKFVMGCCRQRGRLSVAQRAEIRQLVGEKSCAVGVEFCGLCWWRPRKPLLAPW